MTKDEALKLALKALEVATTPLAKDRQEVLRARAAIREALVQQEVVLPGGGHTPAIPVAVYGYCPECGGAGVMRERKPGGDDKCTNGHKYPSSKALAQPEQEPVAWFRYETVYEYKNQLARCTKDCIGAFPVYTTPPQRKPLTDDEIHAIYDEVARREPYNMAVTRRNIARAIEAAHGIKGEA